MSNIDENKTINQLSSSQRLLLALQQARSKLEAMEALKEPIAIIGMGCRFPGGADGPDTYWRLLSEGVDGIREVPSSRWDVNAFYDPTPATAGKMCTRWGGFLSDIDQFEPQFFGISPREAENMDPQQRLLLEVSWEALENAGMAPDKYTGSKSGVFVGISSNDYSRLQTEAGRNAYSGTGNAFSIAANRLSYLLDLRGPSLAVDTACSSSLVALHQAVTSLRQGECDLALAGGVNLILSPDLTITFSQARMMAPDGRCKTFDASADGYVRGEGCGIVVLKRLSDAQRDGDRILALVRGSAVNQDGRSNGLTAPNGLAQQAVIRQALMHAEVAPAQISYIEAHGTGTSLGDPIEVNSLKEVLMPGRSLEQRCFLGSAKTNIGHLEAAAGIAGLIKVVLSLLHGEIPPHLHLKELNPHISIEGTPLSIPTEGQPWPDAPAERRLAGVSSFGFGGTNAHVILEEAPAPAGVGAIPCGCPGFNVGAIPCGCPGRAERPKHLLTLSAKSEKSLLELAHRYSKFLASHIIIEGDDGISLADVCFTANTGRSHFEHRLAVVTESTMQLHEQLSTFVAGEPSTRVIKGQVQLGHPKIAFLFTGQGSQYIGMGQQLYESEPIFRQALERCDEILRDPSFRSGWPLSVPLLSVLYPESEPSQDMPGERPLLDQTAYTQPALFALEYALAELWKSWGIEPDVVMGHSVGEYVAACVAGVFSLEDGLKLIAERGRLMQATEKGEMVAVFADEEQVAAAIYDLFGQCYAQEVSIAAINGPKSLVISGKRQAVQAVVEKLRANGVESRTLKVSHAFHSPLMEPILADFLGVACDVTFSPPHLDVVSNVTGKLATTEIATPEYWCRHIRQSVRFAEGIATLHQQGAEILVEVGPKPTLLGMSRRCLPAEVALIPSLRPSSEESSDWEQMLHSLGQLYVRGVPVEWSDFWLTPRRRVVLPTYPWNRKRYWLSSKNGSSTSSTNGHHKNGFAGAAPKEGHLRTYEKADIYAWTPIFNLLHEGNTKLVASRFHASHFSADQLKLQLELLEGLVFEHKQQLTALKNHVVESNGHDLVEPETALKNHVVESNGHYLVEPETAARSAAQNGSYLKQEARAEHSTTLTREALLAAEPKVRQQLLEAYLREQVAKVLGLWELDIHRSLNQLGLDSLMAIELRNQIESATGVVMPMAKLLQGPPVTELVTQVLERVTTAAPLTPFIPSGQTITEFPLSYGQQAQWFLYQMAPESAAYNVSFAARVRSDLDLSLLRAVFQTLSDRHPSLRTTYTIRDGKPIQQLQEKLSVHISETDASEWNWSELKERLVSETHRPFDLERGPVMRLSVCTLSPEEHILLLTAHHIAIDLWSLGVLMDEFRILYNAERAGDQASLPLLNNQYADYVRWQADMLAGPQGERLWAYWQNQLAGELPALNLPTNRPRPPVQTYRGTSYSLKLENNLAQGLKEIAKANEATLYTTLLAGFQVLLHRCTGQEDILVGSATAGRSRADTMRIVGYFVNPVPLRADLSGNPTFNTFLGQVRETVLAAIEHQDYPFSLLVEQLQPTRNASLPPIFQVAFMLERSIRPEQQGAALFTMGQKDARLTLGELVFESFDLEQQAAQYDLMLMMEEVDGTLYAAFQYNTDLFDAATIQRMASHFQSLLEAIVANPEQRIGTLPLLTKAERVQQLIDWNDTQREYPQEKCVHQLFEAWVEQTPDALAVLSLGQQLSYRELDHRANQLAHYLQAKGVGPEVLVGICISRCPEMVVGILAVLKAGGAYVPLDPAYPKERLSFMLSDAQVPLLLTEQKLIKDLPEYEADVICLDTEWETIAQESEAPPICRATANNLAYIIYTSGSTGKPKGVLVTNRGLCNVSAAQIQLFEVGAGDRVLQFSSLSFDASAFEMFMALCTGASLCLGTRESLSPGQPLLQLLKEQGVTIVTLTPSTLAALPVEELPALRIINVAGEACPADLVTRWTKGRQFFNLYGPTEATIWTTAAECLDGNQPPPIGRPIANTQVYLLDSYLQPVPVGVPGELCIGGIGLSRGYLKRPKLTSEKFIPNPFSNDPEARLYKTGDLARYLPDGNIEFLGRIDHQVKLRGFRIELEEIEAALSQYPGVRKTVVLVREDEPGRKQLVAYVVANEEEPPLVSTWRRYLQKTLPEYMVPSAFVTLEAFPLTSSGKVDRRALPAPERTRAQLEEAFVPPSTPIEEILVEIWAEVLGLERVGIHDDFFELGGHSLIAAKIVSRVRDTFQIDFPLHNLFETTTIADLGVLVEEILLDDIEDLSEDEAQRLVQKEAL